MSRHALDRRPSDPTYCDSNTCPARVSCRQHAWRSPEYAAMAPFNSFTGEPTPYADSCSRYVYDTRRTLMDEGVPNVLPFRRQACA